jgi:hypothetical protein
MATITLLLSSTLNTDLLVSTLLLSSSYMRLIDI